jgi:hypothetical protein
MIQQTIHKRTCKCGCGEKFETTNIKKVYVDKVHQKNHNNMIQNEKRKRMASVTSLQMRTYWIFDELLGKKDSCWVHEQFLIGRNADLNICSNLDNVNGEILPVLKDIAIKLKLKKINLIRIKNDKARHI